MLFGDYFSHSLVELLFSYCLVRVFFSSLRLFFISLFHCGVEFTIYTFKSFSMGSSRRLRFSIQPLYFFSAGGYVIFVCFLILLFFLVSYVFKAFDLIVEFIHRVIQSLPNRVVVGVFAAGVHYDVVSRHLKLPHFFKRSEVV